MVTPVDGVAAEDEARPFQLSFVALLWIALLSPTVAMAGEAESDRVVSFDISRQRADQALIEFAEQADVTFIFPADKARKITANAVRGEFTPKVAIVLLLEGTGLQPRVQADGALTVNVEEGSADKGDIVKKRGWIAGIVAVLAATTAVDARADQETEAKTITQLNEILVTAQKKEERLEDVPVPVTVITGATLAASDLTQLQDYYSKVPGLNLGAGSFNGEPQLAIRGLTTGGFTNPVVGIVVDDVPYGSSLGLTLGNWAPDFDPSDLSRVEVLRGPQGTLYGASSMGGLVKFVTVDPSTDRTSGRLEAGLNTVKNGDELGYEIRGAINIPLGDAWAVRASGYSRSDSGYIDNPGIGVEGINSVEVNGGRLSTLWRPSESFSLKFSAMVQRATGDGSSFAHLLPGLKDLEQQALPGTGWYKKDLQVYTAILNAQLGAAELTSISGYNINDANDLLDIGGLALRDDYKTKKFTQEVRVSFPLGQKLDWLIGAFYTDEETDPLVQEIWTLDPATGAQTGTFLRATARDPFTEYAAFTNLTFQVSDRFDLQVGGRQSHITLSDTSSVAFPPAPDIFTPKVSTEADAFTYLVTPRFRFSPDVLGYFRLASGYRTGGVNTNTAISGGPRDYEPDETQSYEIGMKGVLFDGMLSIDASAYYIDWKDIQIQIISPSTFRYTINAGRAKSEGLELSVVSRPVTGFTVSAWVAWNDAVLTEDFPPDAAAFGAEGDRLPFGSRFSGNLSLDYEFPVSGRIGGFAGASVSYVGDRAGDFKATADSSQPIYPSYVQTDLRVGIQSGSWMVNAFVNNVADERGVLTNPGLSPSSIFYIQPRTIGMSVSKDF